MRLSGNRRNSSQNWGEPRKAAPNQTFYKYCLITPTLEVVGSNPVSRTKRKKSEPDLPHGETGSDFVFSYSSQYVSNDGFRRPEFKAREPRKKKSKRYELLFDGVSTQRNRDLLYKKVRFHFSLRIRSDHMLLCCSFYRNENAASFFGSRFVKFPMVARPKYHGHISRVNRYFIPPGMLCKSLRELFLNTQKCSPLRTDRPEGDAAGLIFLPAPQRAGTPARSGRCTKRPRDPGRRKAVRHSARPRRSPRPTESPWRHCAGCGRSSGAAM